jgi:tetratricopeptide (TPR) repeat protein
VGGKELDLQGWREAVGVALNGGIDLSRLDLLGEWVERLLALDPKDFMGQLARAGTLIETGRVAEAAAAYAELRTAHPYEHTAYEQLALLSALDGRLDEALELADSALNLSQTCSFAWATRGYVYFLRGQWLAAQADLKTAWNRANMAERRYEFVYWWILAELQNDRWLALDRKMKARHETHIDWRRHQLAQTQAQLKVWAADPSRRRTLRQRWGAFMDWLRRWPLRARSAAARLAYFARRTGLGRLKM